MTIDLADLTAFANRSSQNNFDEIGFIESQD
jgi:hypothetical protein